MSIIQGIGIGIATMIINEIPWSSIFLITQLFGIRLYLLKRKHECQQIQKKIGSWCSHMTEDGKGYGYSLGFWYLLHVTTSPSDMGENYSAWIISTAASYKGLIEEREASIHLTNSVTDKKGAEEEKCASINFYQRYGSYQNPYFIKRSLTLSIKPREEQEKIMKAILTQYNKSSHTVVYLHGPPGTGKSMIPILLTTCVKGSYCNTLKPWQPGDSLVAVYNDVSPTETSPLIIAFDEIDSALVKITDGIPPHKTIPISIGDKTGWNHMLDEIQRGLFPHLIIILTSNKTPKYINDLDASYLRKGRVDLIFPVKTLQV